ncbi:MAG: AbrB/MazE/SpoVT family DNA-binding domain-containing protein [Chloroflexi bacterium]|nr:AbrB/MazE/SpoVT family DNA-binding domain-containing protein [Chloroflexota bacterium]
MAIIKVSAKGQLVIPKPMREAMGLVEGVKCRVDKVGNKIVLRPAGMAEQATWRRWRGRLKGTRALEAHIEEHRREIAQDEHSI